MAAHTSTASAQTYTWREFNLYYEVSGSGAPVVLLHGFGAGSSGFQWRRNVAALARKFTVYNLDLLGWGRSDQPQLMYDAPFYIALIGDFLQAVVGAPAALVGSFQTAAYALAVAAQRPELVRALVLQTPSGLNYLRDQKLLGKFFYAQLYYTPLGAFLYSQIATRSGVAGFMRQRMYTRADLVDDTAIDTFTELAQRPGGRWGAAAFLSGRLNLDVRKILPQVRQPVLVLWGDRTSFIPAAEAQAFTNKLLDARSVVLGPAEIWFNDERAEEWNQAVVGFLGQVM